MQRNLVLTVECEQAVTGNSDDECRHRDGRECRAHATAPAADVVRTHRLDECDVAVGVETAGELVAMEVEVRLHSEAASLAEWADGRLP